MESESTQGNKSTHFVSQRKAVRILTLSGRLSLLLANDEENRLLSMEEDILYANHLAERKKTGLNQETQLHGSLWLAGKIIVAKKTSLVLTEHSDR